VHIVPDVFQTFMIYARELDLRDMMDEVSQQLREGRREAERGSRDNKKLFFNPGLHAENNTVSKV
jgi:hypothetical protein